MKILSEKRLINPWMTDGILGKEQHKHTRLYKLSRVNENYFPMLIRHTKLEYFLHKHNSCFSDAKATWKTINNILGRSAK